MILSLLLLIIEAKLSLSWAVSGAGPIISCKVCHCRQKLPSQQSGALSLVGRVEIVLPLVESFIELKYFHDVAMPALFCHKEPARRIQSPRQFLGSNLDIEVDQSAVKHLSSEQHLDLSRTLSGALCLIVEMPPPSHHGLHALIVLGRVWRKDMKDFYSK